MVIPGLPIRLLEAQNRQQPIEGQSEMKTKKNTKQATKDSTASKDKDHHSAKSISQQWFCIGASVQGTRHIISDSPCQDYHRCEYLPTGELVVAVADGAGSAAQSEIGARLACEAAVENLKCTVSHQKLDTDEVWQAAIYAAFKAGIEKLVCEAYWQEVAVREFATTLIIMVFTQDLVVGGMVGDGAGVVCDIQGNFWCIFTPQKGEYVNQTYFLTTPHALDKLEIQFLRSPPSAAALLTDGLIRLSCNTLQNQPHARFFEPLFKFCVEAQNQAMAQQELANWLASEQINGRTDDDKTLVLITKKPLTEGRNMNNEGTRSERENVSAQSRDRQRERRKANKSQ